MITANVPSAKKLIVHGPDLSSIPSQFPILEVTPTYPSYVTYNNISQANLNDMKSSKLST